MVLIFLNVVLLGPDTERMLRVCRMYKNGISGISTMRGFRGAARAAKSLRWSV